MTLRNFEKSMPRHMQQQGKLIINGSELLRVMKLHSHSRKTEIEKMERDIRKLSKRHDGNDSDDEPSQKKAKMSYLQEELDKYSKSRRVSKKGKDGKRKDEGNVLAALNSFRSKLQVSAFMGDEEAGDGDKGDTAEMAAGEDPGIEVDDDKGFMSHALHFPKDDGEEGRKAERDYEVIDPRARGAKAKEEEREKRRAMKAKGGARYRSNK
jgi:peptidyl-prolyl cis-trans isomerase SDCCAG10